MAHDVLADVEGEQHAEGIPAEDLVSSHFIDDIFEFGKKAQAIRVPDYNNIEIFAPVTDEQLDVLKHTPQFKQVQFINGPPKYTTPIERALRLKHV